MTWPMRDLADHTVRVWVESEQTDDLRGVSRTYTEYLPAEPALVQRRRSNLVHRPGGEAESGQWRVFMDPLAIPADARVVLEIYEGPEAYRTLRVVDDYRPRGAFLQIAAQEWEGTLSG